MFMKSSQDQIRITHFEWYLPFPNLNWDGEIDVFFLFSFTVGTSKKRGHGGMFHGQVDFFGVERLVMMDVLPRSWKNVIFETWKWDVLWVTLSDPKLAAQEIPEWFAFKSVARDPVDPQWQFSWSAVSGWQGWFGLGWLMGMMIDCRYLVLAAEDLHSTKESWRIHVGTLQNRSCASTAHVYLL